MRAAGLALLVLLAGASPAFGAGTVDTPFDGRVQYEASGVANVVATDSLEANGDVVVTVAEQGIALDAGATGCVDNGNEVVCTFPGPINPHISAELSNLDDTFDAGGLTQTTVTVSDGFPASGGADTVTGSNVAVSVDGFSTGDSLTPGGDGDTVFGGAGNDQIGLGDEAATFVDGGSGDDRLIITGGNPDPVADTFRGGAGIDQFYPRSVVEPHPDYAVDLAARTVSIIGSANPADAVEDYEDIRADEGNDVLIGDDGPNIIESGDGNDRLVGALGPDTLFGEDGDDRLEARDGIAELVDGGADADTCVIDQLDEVSDCEVQELVSVTPFGAILPDVDPPACQIRALKGRLPAKRLTRRGLSFRADCDEPGRVTAVLTGRLRSAGGVGLARAGDVELGRASERTNASGDARLRLRVGRKLRRLVRRGSRLKLRLQARDTVGNRAATRVRTVRPK